MSAFEPYGTLPAELPDLLTELAAPRLPDYTDDVLAITAATRQRPPWANLERWLPMIVTRQRLVAPPLPWRPVLAVLVTLALLAGALFVASQQKRLPPPFGPAANGAIVYDRDGDLFIRDGLGGPERLLVGGRASDLAPGFTRDGRHVTFLRRVAGIPNSPSERVAAFLANTDGTNAVALTGPLEAPNWADLSPDDSTLVMQAVDETQTAFGDENTRSKLYRVSLVNPGPIQAVPLPIEAATTPSFRGPDGSEIVFRGFRRAGPILHTGVFAARLDGSEMRALTAVDGNTDSDYNQPLLSPDGRLLTYTSWSEAMSQLQVHLVDLTTGGDRVVTERDAPSEGFATFSPDGTRIVFVRYFPNSDEIWVRPVAPGSTAVPAGPAYPMVENQYIASSFSPDGKYVIVNDPASEETRLVDAVTGGYGTLLPWAVGGFQWQRIAP
jgi:hypothetical protein